MHLLKKIDPKSQLWLVSNNNDNCDEHSLSCST